MVWSSRSSSACSSAESENAAAAGVPTDTGEATRGAWGRAPGAAGDTGGMPGTPAPVDAGPGRVAPGTAGRACGFGRGAPGAPGVAGATLGAMLGAAPAGRAPGGTGR